MEPFRIYGKTELGAAALNAARGALPSSARQLLILIDGQRTVGELQGMFGEEALQKLLPQLEVQGYVKYLRDSPAARPATISGGRPATLSGSPAPTISGARPPTISVATRQPAATAATVAAAPAPAGNGLAKSLLALGVLAVSGALWWFLGQARLPGIGAIPDATPGVPVVAGPAAEPAAPAPAVPVSPVATVGFDRPVPRIRDTARPEARSATAGAAPARPAAALATPATVAGSAAEVPRTAAPAGAALTGGAGASLATGKPVVPAADGSNAAALAPATGKTPSASAAASAAASSVAPVPASPVSGAAAPANATATATTAAASSPLGGKNAVTPGAPVLHPRERTMPVLPKSARRAGVDSGELVVRLHVTARGTVESVDVVKANPRQVYDLTIEQTLKKWTFDPPGAPVESTVEFSFKP